MNMQIAPNSCVAEAFAARDSRTEAGERPGSRTRRQGDDRESRPRNSSGRGRDSGSSWAGRSLFRGSPDEASARRNGNRARSGSGRRQGDCRIGWGWAVPGGRSRSPPRMLGDRLTGKSHPPSPALSDVTALAAPSPQVTSSPSTLSAKTWRRWRSRGAPPTAALPMWMGGT